METPIWCQQTPLALSCHCHKRPLMGPGTVRTGHLTTWFCRFHGIPKWWVEVQEHTPRTLIFSWGKRTNWLSNPSKNLQTDRGAVAVPMVGEWWPARPWRDCDISRPQNAPCWKPISEPHLKFWGSEWAQNTSKNIKTHQKTKAGGHGLIGVEISRASEQKYGVSTGDRLWEAFWKHER